MDWFMKLSNKVFWFFANDTKVALFKNGLFKFERTLNGLSNSSG